MDRKTVILVLAYKRVNAVRKALQRLSNTNIPCVVSIDRDDRLTRSQQNETFKATEAEFPDVQFRTTKSNLGLVNHFLDAVGNCFRTFDNVIVLEDDIVVPRKVVLATQTQLQSRFSPEIMAVSLFPGIPSISLWRKKKNVWRRSPYFCPWGFALQKEDWSEFSIVLPSSALKELEQSKLFKQMSSKRQDIWRHRIEKVISNPQFTYDTQLQYLLFTKERKTLVPLFRASENLGFADEFAVHTKGDKPRWIIGSPHAEDFDLQPSQSKFLERLCIFWDSFTIGGDRLMFWRK